MKTKILIVLGILLLGGMPLFANNTWIKFDGIQGESTSPGHQGWIEVMSFSWAVNQAGSMAHGGGGGEGKASFHDLSFTHQVDKASPALMNATATGKHFPNVILEANGQRYQLQEVIITSDQRSATGGGGFPLETIKMTFVRDTLHLDPPAPPTPNRGAVTGALVPAVQMGPNATINGGNVMLHSLKLVGQTQAIIVVCDVAGGQSVAALQRASQSRQAMPTVSIHANPKQPGQAGMSWTLNNAMVSSYSTSASGCPQVTLNFTGFSGPAGGY
jgi:type VI protein secretion system component Hcp